MQCVVFTRLYFSIVRKVGPRSRVWTEKEMLEISAYEFAEVRYSVTSLFPEVINFFFLL